MYATNRAKMALLEQATRGTDAAVPLTQFKAPSQLSLCLWAESPSTAVLPSRVRVATHRIIPKADYLRGCHACRRFGITLPDCARTDEVGGTNIATRYPSIIPKGVAYSIVWFQWCVKHYVAQTSMRKPVRRKTV